MTQDSNSRDRESDWLAWVTCPPLSKGVQGNIIGYSPRLYQVEKGWLPKKDKSDDVTKR